MGNCFNKSSKSSTEQDNGNGSTYEAPESVGDIPQTQGTPNNTKASTENPIVADESSGEEISNVACFGAGCYWGTEKYFTIDFARRRYPESLIRGRVGKYCTLCIRIMIRL